MGNSPNCTKCGGDTDTQTVSNYHIKTLTGVLVIYKMFLYPRKRKLSLQLGTEEISFGELGF